MSRHVSVTPIYRGGERGQTLHFTRLDTATAMIRQFLHPPQSRSAQYKAIDEAMDKGEPCTITPVVLPGDRAADIVELHYNGHFVWAYQRSDLPPLVGARPEQMFDRRIERDIQPFLTKARVGGTGKHQLAVKAIIKDFMDNTEVHPPFHDGDVNELYEKIAPHLK